MKSTLWSFLLGILLIPGGILRADDAAAKVEAAPIVAPPPPASPAQKTADEERIRAERDAREERIKAEREAREELAQAQAMAEAALASQQNADAAASSVAAPAAPTLTIRSPSSSHHTMSELLYDSGSASHSMDGLF